MPFATVAVPFDAYRDLPTPQHRWVLLCLARYADREGRCWPSMRQLAVDSRMSLATVCRYLKSMAEIGVFHRTRQGVGRYRYRLAEAYVPRWPGRVSRAEPGVPRGGTKQATHPKHYNYKKITEDTCHDESSRWEARLRAWAKSRFWLPFWGPKPTELGCFAPSTLLDTNTAGISMSPSSA